MNTVKINGMSCQHCVSSVQEVLEKISEISSVSVDLEKGEAKYNGDIEFEKVKQAIVSIGFEVVGG